MKTDDLPPSSNEIPFIFDLTKDSQFLQEEVLRSDSICIDSNNHLYVPTAQNIYVLSLKNRAFNKNWIKHHIKMPNLLEQYKKQSGSEFFYQDQYTALFNNNAEEEKNHDIQFLKHITAKEFTFDSEVMRNRLVFMNSFDPISLKINRFMISPLGLTMRNKPILTVVLNNSECYLLSYQIGNSMKEFRIDFCLNEFLIKSKKITHLEELGSVAWSKDLKQSNGEVTAILAAHFASKIFLWEIFKNEKDSKIKIQLLSEINMTSFPHKSAHLIIDSCQDPSFFHIAVFAHSRKILFLDLKKHEQSVQEHQLDQKELNSFEIVKKINFYQPDAHSEDQNCHCFIYASSNNKIYEISVKNKSIQLVFKVEEPVYFTSILQKQHQLIFGTINNKLYLWNPVFSLDSSPQSILKPSLTHKFKTLSTLKGLAISRNKLVKVAMGNPSEKQKYSATNIVIFTNFKNSLRVEEIFLKMFTSLKEKLYKDFILKEPLNFDDFLCIISANHKIFVELVDFMKGLFEENSNLDQFTKLKKITGGKHNIIHTKKTMDELLPDKAVQSFILGRLFFTVLMYHAQDFSVFLGDAKKRFLAGFYKDFLTVKIPELEEKFNDQRSRVLMQNMKNNMGSFLNCKNGFEEESGSGVCKICKKEMCELNHSFMKCILTQEDIYMESFYFCKFCNSALIDVEREFKWRNENMGFYFNICPLCLHLVKKPVC